MLSFVSLMKKWLVIFLLTVYGFSSSGMTIQLHYCCGKLKNVEFKPLGQTACKHGMHQMKNKKCCENKSFELKVKSDQKAEHVTAFKFFPVFSEARLINNDLLLKQRISSRLSPVAFAPPPLLPAPLFIMHCVYRI